MHVPRKVAIGDVVLVRKPKTLGALLHIHTSEAMIFPRFHGHRVKSPSPSLRTRRGGGSQVSNAGGLDYRILQSIRTCPAGLLRVSDRADDARVPFSAYERSFPRRHCPSSSRA